MTIPYAPPKPPSPSPPLTPQESSEPQIPEPSSRHHSSVSPSVRSQSNGSAFPTELGIALDAYSLPSIPFPPSPRRTVKLDDRDSYVFASDLSQDEKFGSITSAPYVALTSSMISSQRKITNLSSLGFGALVSPFCYSNSEPPILRRTPVRCEDCGAYVNLYCPVNLQTGEWKCVFCDKSNFSGGEFVLAEGEQLNSWAELCVRVVDYVQPSLRRFSSASDSALSAPVVFVIDETMDPPLLRGLQASLLDVINSLSPTTRIAIISFSQSVAVYDLSQSEVASADVFPGSCPLSERSKSQMTHGATTYLAPRHACIQAVNTIISSLRPYRALKPEIQRRRCLWVAVEAALTVVRGPDTGLPRSAMKLTGGNSRVIVCTSGGITYGPGSLPFQEAHPDFIHEEYRAAKLMEKMGTEAKRLESTIDIMCGGYCPLRACVVLPLARFSGGVMLLHEDFGAAFTANVLSLIGKSVGSRGVLEVRGSKNIGVEQVIGSAEPSLHDAAAEQTYAIDPLVKLDLLSVDEGNGLALCFKLFRDISQPYIYLQFSTQYTDVNHSEIVRVITVRLQCTDSVTEYLRSVDEDVLAVVIAKRSVLQAIGPKDAIELRSMIDLRLRDISVKLGKPVPLKGMYEFPRELPRIAEALLHLKRGPLLGGIIGHEDERSVMRDVFLRSNFSQSLSMTIPRIFMLDDAEFSNPPPHNTILRSDAAFLLDHGTEIFIWIGKSICFDPDKDAFARARCFDLANELAQHRFPSPKILLIPV